MLGSGIHMNAQLYQNKSCNHACFDGFSLPPAAVYTVVCLCVIQVKVTALILWSMLASGGYIVYCMWFAVAAAVAAAVVVAVSVFGCDSLEQQAGISSSDSV